MTESPTGRKSRDLTPAEAVDRFVAKRRNKNTDKTVRSYENRLRQFVRWGYEHDEIEVMRDLDIMTDDNDDE